VLHENTSEGSATQSFFLVTYRDQSTNEEILLRIGSSKLSDIVSERRFHMAGHVYSSSSSSSSSSFVISSMSLVERCCRHQVPPVSTILRSPPRGVQTNVGRFQIVFNSSSRCLSLSSSRSFPVSRRSSNSSSTYDGDLFPVQTLHVLRLSNHRSSRHGLQ